MSTWVYRITTRHAGRIARRRRVRGLLSKLLMREPQTPDPSERSERLLILDDLVSKLSLKKRLVVVLFEIEGTPIDEIAKIAGCTKNTAWSRLHYGRAELMTMAKRRLR